MLHPWVVVQVIHPQDREDGGRTKPGLCPMTREEEPSPVMYPCRSSIGILEGYLALHHDKGCSCWRKGVSPCAMFKSKGSRSRPPFTSLASKEMTKATGIPSYKTCKGEEVTLQVLPRVAFPGFFKGHFLAVRFSREEQNP